MNDTPVRLEKDTIVDCVVEMRFRPGSDSISGVLPGLLYGIFKDDYPKVTQTAESQLPPQIRASDQTLRLKPTTLLQGTKGHIGIADEAIQLSVTRPYPGWSGFRPLAEELFEKFLETGLSNDISRVSILYSNLLDVGQTPHDLSPLRVKLSVGEKLTRRDPGTSVRFEVEGDGAISVIQINNGATAMLRKNTPDQEELSGLFIRVDTISTNSVDDEGVIRTLDRIHKEEKRVFFGILTEETIEALGPKWD